MVDFSRPSGIDPLQLLSFAQQIRQEQARQQFRIQQQQRAQQADKLQRLNLLQPLVRDADIDPKTFEQLARPIAGNALSPEEFDALVAGKKVAAQKASQAAQVEEAQRLIQRTSGAPGAIPIAAAGQDPAQAAFDFQLQSRGIPVETTAAHRQLGLLTQGLDPATRERVVGAAATQTEAIRSEEERRFKQEQRLILERERSAARKAVNLPKTLPERLIAQAMQAGDIPTATRIHNAMVANASIIRSDAKLTILPDGTQIIEGDKPVANIFLRTHIEKEANALKTIHNIDQMLEIIQSDPRFAGTAGAVRGTITKLVGIAGDFSPENQEKVRQLVTNTLVGVRGNADPEVQKRIDSVMLDEAKLGDLESIAFVTSLTLAAQMAGTNRVSNKLLDRAETVVDPRSFGTMKGAVASLLRIRASSAQDAEISARITASDPAAARLSAEIRDVFNTEDPINRIPVRGGSVTNADMNNIFPDFDQFIAEQERPGAGAGALPDNLSNEETLRILEQQTPPRSR